jgi:hypothetical protein
MQSIISWIRVVAFVYLVATSVHSQGRIRRNDRVQERAFFAVTADSFATGTGCVIEGRGGPPWFSSDVAATEGGRFLRRFGRFLYVVNTEAGSITRLRRDGSGVQTIDLGPGSLPQDVRLTAPQTVYITRRDDPRLFRYDLVTRTGSDVADLGVLAEGNETLRLRMLHSDGDRLFVQVDLRGPLNASRGVLGVVDSNTGQLVDVDPLRPGVQGIPLAGAPPQLRMQILGRTLFVSTTGNRLDNRGGIERVDLDTLASVGFALTEAQLGGVDLGGFVMVSADEGYVVAHTDIVPSTHLRHFTITGGATPGPDLVMLLGDAVESLAYDARRSRLYLPSGFAGFGAPQGVHVLDTRTNLPLVQSPIPTAARVHDVVVAR